MCGDFNDYTVASADLYKKKNAWYTSNPKVGDQIFFKNSTRICHTGLVYKVDSKYVYTIEGNTSSGASVVFAIGGIPTPAISRAFAVEWLNSTESSVSATHLAYGYLESNMISFYALANSASGYYHGQCIYISAS